MTGGLRIAHHVANVGISETELASFCVENKEIFEENIKSDFGPEVKKWPPSGQTASYRNTEVIQSYLKMWGSYDLIALSQVKKRGHMGVA